MTDGDEIVRLRARVAGLEAALERRSRELRLIQRLVCERDLVLIARVTSGLSPLVAGDFDIEQWPESHALTGADVEKTLLALWDSVVPSELRRDA